MKITSFLMTLLVIVFSFNPGEVLAAEISLPKQQPAFLSPEDNPNNQDNESPSELEPAEGEILIQEVVSNPEAGAEEWIEIQILAEIPRNGAGITVSDAVGVLYTFEPETILNPGELLVLSGWGSKLNNTGDSVIIRTAAGKVIAQLPNFPKLEKGESWAYDKQEYRISKTPTPGEENQFPEADPGEESQHPPAQLGELLISEIMSDPDIGEEWIEFTLEADSIRDLSGFTIHDNTGEIYQFSAGSTLEPGDYFVATGWGNKLNNSGDSVIVKSGDKEIIAEALDFPATGKGRSWLPTEETFGIPSPGEENSIHEETIETPGDPPAGTLAPIAGELQISEIYSNPEAGESEWVEIVSAANVSLSLQDCLLSDANGALYLFPAEVMIEPGELLVVSGWGDKLNNTGDTVTLTNSNQVVLSVAELPALAKGESWLPSVQRKGDPTPGEENEPKAELPPATNVNEEEGTSEYLLPTNGEILINEISSNPDTNESEWIELVSSASEIRHLGGLVLTDRAGEVYVIPGGTEILPAGYVVITGWGNKLNNTGDSAYLSLPDGTRLDKISDFPALKHGESYARFPDGDKKTSMPTPGSENIFRDPVTHPAKGGSSKRKYDPIVRTESILRSARIDEYDIVISEVMFHGSEDFIELECRTCDLDLKGIRVADDDAFFEFPEDTHVASGERVVLRFTKEDFKPYKEGSSWFFPAGKSGLTGTDETVFLLDSYNNVEDAVCIANRDGKFSPGEKDDVFRLIRERKINGLHPLSENVCYDSRLLGREQSLTLGAEKTGTAYSDYFATSETTPGNINTKPPNKSEQTNLVIQNAWQATAEMVFVEIVNQSNDVVSTKGFSMTTGDEASVDLKKMLLPEQSVFLMIAKAENEEEILLVDAWQTEESKKQIEKMEFTPGTPKLRISEVVANPEGVDSGQEFIELICTAKECDSNQFLLMIGDSPLIIEEKIRQDELLVLYDQPLRNTNLDLTIFDLESQTSEYVHIEKAETGKSLALYEDQKHWTNYPTPGEPNIIANNDSRADSDRDGIPDFAEIIIGSDAMAADQQNSTPYKLFLSYLRNSSSLSVVTDQEEIRIQGKTLPHSQVRIVLHSDRHVVQATANANGIFAAISHPDLKKGDHRADLVVTAPSGETYVFPDQNRFSIDQDLRDGWISTIEIVAVVPNPTGKDAGREMVILRNTGNEDGWLKNAALASGKKKVSLSDTFFKAGQRKIIAGDSLPQLKNSTGELQLIDVDGKLLSQIDWKRAKSGRWYGSEALEPAKKKKAGNKASKKQRSPYIPPETESIPIFAQEGVFWSINGNMIEVRDPQGEIQAYPLDEQLSAETLQQLLQPGKSITVFIADGKAIRIQTHYYQPASIIQEQWSSVFYLVLLILLLGAIFISFATQQIRKKAILVSQG